MWLVRCEIFSILKKSNKESYRIRRYLGSSSSYCTNDNSNKVTLFHEPIHSCWEFNDFCWTNCWVRNSERGRLQGIPHESAMLVSSNLDASSKFWESKKSKMRVYYWVVKRHLSCCNLQFSLQDSVTCLNRWICGFMNSQFDNNMAVYNPDHNTTEYSFSSLICYA